MEFEDPDEEDGEGVKGPLLNLNVFVGVLFPLDDDEVVVVVVVEEFAEFKSIFAFDAKSRNQWLERLIDAAQQ